MGSAMGTLAAAKVTIRAEVAEPDHPLPPAMPRRIEWMEKENAGNQILTQYL